MRTFLALAAVMALSSGGVAAGKQVDASPPTDQATGGKVLFYDGFDGTGLDRKEWNVVGTDFWVNNEQQAYVDSPETVSIVQGLEGANGGALALTPVYQPGVDPNPQRHADFLSGRINSRGKFDFTYGKAEARIRLPADTGIWPAFWLLGYGEWPKTGEIDIMENVGEPDWYGVALHGKGYSGETPLVNKYFFPAGIDVTQWHTYAVDWRKNEILFSVDGRLTYRVTRPMVEHYGKWDFANRKYIILNFALGGAYPYKTNGIEEPYQGMPQSTVERIKAGKVAMYVDWVKVTASKN
ncbi:glycoside hydrolase family 16 protein [Tsuneonella mangrovi]|uniref:glycoside hydrolase family 16 protein n=1 Tax=Tsuneonella mangrovi TaxID=1982042 RepID=UPI00196B0385|nr:family 16 glycosylhydrolase [Tsuneonella mangrovi]